MKKTKRLFLALAPVAVAALPLVVVSCNNTDKKDEAKTTTDIARDLGVKFEDSNVTQKLNGIGSSSVYPILEALVNLSNDKLTYAPKGSGEGLNAMKGDAPTKSFGMTSSTKVPGKDETTWKNANIRTLTFAIDAIAIAVHLPKGAKTTGGAKPIVDFNKIRDLYVGKPVTWSQLVTNLSEQNDTRVVALGRIGGKNASGTADGFMHTLLHGASKDDLNGKSKSDVQNHGWFKNDNDSYWKTTNEANSEALKILKGLNNGGITYLSLGYALKNEQKGKMEVAIVQKGSETWTPTVDNAKKGLYKWTRPFNIIYEVTDPQVLNLAKYLISNNIQKFIAEIGFVPLSDDQKTIQGDLTKTDADLYRENKSNPDNLSKFATKEGKTIAVGLNV